MLELELGFGLGLGLVVQKELKGRSFAVQIFVVIYIFFFIFSLPFLVRVRFWIRFRVSRSEGAERKEFCSSNLERLPFKFFFSSSLAFLVIYLFFRVWL